MHMQRLTIIAWNVIMSDSNQRYNQWTGVYEQKATHDGQNTEEQGGYEPKTTQDGQQTEEMKATRDGQGYYEQKEERANTYHDGRGWYSWVVEMDVYICLGMTTTYQNNLAYL